MSDRILNNGWVVIFFPRSKVWDGEIFIGHVCDGRFCPPERFEELVCNQCGTTATTGQKFLIQAAWLDAQAKNGGAVALGVCKWPHTSPAVVIEGKAEITEI